MKRFLQILIFFLAASCSSYVADEEESQQEEKKNVPVSLAVRSSSPDAIHYPLSVFIFNKEGKLISQNEINSPTDSLFSTRLAPGEYLLSAFSGLNNTDYQWPEITTDSSYIHTPTNFFCATALQHGQVAFKLTKKTELSIHLAYIVSSLSFQFNQIPADATSVEVSVTPVSSGYSFNGNYTNDRETCTAQCQRNGDSWETGPVYILPSNSPQTTLTLNIERPSGTETLSYTYHYQLQAAQPYRFSGNYHESIGLSGTFEIEGWKPGIDVEFDFTEEGAEQNPDTPLPPQTDEELDIVYGSSLPEVGKFWDNLYVWKVNKVSEKEVIATFLSPDQWNNVLASEGAAILNEYTSNGYDQWKVFSTEEARTFYAECGRDLDQLNNTLRSKGQATFYYESGERYLCNDFHSTFNLYGKLIVRKAGTKTQYYLRGVKTVKIRKQS